MMDKFPEVLKVNNNYFSNSTGSSVISCRFSRSFRSLHPADIEAQESAMSVTDILQAPM